MSLMIDTPTTVEVPLRTDEDGTIRIGPTRVTLDTVITAFQQGETPEKIIDSFDVLKLVDVYAVIAYYLAHRDTVDEYLRQQRAEGERIRRIIEASQPDMSELRARLLAYREEKKRSE